MRTIMTNFTCASVDRRRFVASFVCIITAAVLTHAVAGDAVKDTTEIVRDSANAALVEEAADTALSLQDEQLDTVFTDTVAVIPDSAENAAAATPDSGAIQTADTASAAKAAEFLNPFASGGESALPGSVGVSESDTAVQARHSDGKRCRYKTVLMSGMALQQLPVDLFLDVSMGFGFSRFDVESPFYSTRGDADFIFDLGVVFPFRRVFFAKAAVRSLQLAYAISDSTADFMGSYFTTRADEWLHYLSLPMSVGCKFTIGPCSPYIFVRCEPAYLTSSHEVVERKSFTLFLPDSSTYTIVSVADNQTTDRRARGQVFVGGGGGVELSYGYGYLYIDGGVQIALIQTGYRDVSPEHAKSLFWIFPISAGLRFYL